MMIIEGNIIRPSLCFPVAPLSRRVAVELFMSRGGRTNDVFFDADFVNAGDLDRVGAVARLHDGQVHGDALATQISISESADGAPELPRQSKIAAFQKIPHGISKSSTF